MAFHRLFPTGVRHLTAAAATVMALAACSAGGAVEGPARPEAAGDLTVWQPFTEEANARQGAPVEIGTSPSGNYLAGRQAQARRDLAAAAEFFKKALAKDPDKPHLLRRAFLLMAMEGRIDEAAELARRLLDEEPDNPIANLVLMVQDTKAGRFQAVKERLTTLPESGLNMFMGPLLRAWVHVGLGDIDAALAELDHREEGSGGLSALHNLHAALISQSAGRLEQAEAFFKQATTEGAGMSLRVTELLGRLYESTGRGDAARELYLSYQHQHPGSVLITPLLAQTGEGAVEATPITPANGIAEALFGIASSLRQQSAQETALVFVRLAVHLKPDFPVAQLLLADILENDDRFLDANRIYEALNDASPFSWTADLRRATNLDRLERVDEAVATLEVMAERQPAEYSPLVQLGDILSSHKRYKAAVSAYDRALERLPEITPAHWPLLYARGIALERSGDWQRAEQDFLKALEMEPEQPYVLNYLGYTWVEKGVNLERAQDMIKRAVDLRPSDGYIVDSLGWVQYRLGHFRDAVKNLERAAALQPDDATINDHLGDALWAAGRRLEARFQWRRVLSLNPDDDLRRSVEDKLQRGLQVVPAPPSRTRPRPEAAGVSAPAAVRILAPAKVNLYLRVTGRREDGFHLLDSLAAFASVGDSLTAGPAETLTLDVRGPFAAALADCPDADNLVIAAARSLAAAAGIAPKARLVLDKRLPVASGIGGGSADAAAALRVLAALWRLDLDGSRLAEIALSLGADVPVCLHGRPAFMAGIGEALSPAPPLPPAWLVLVNPGIAVSTPAVFKARTGPFGPPAPFTDTPGDAAALADLLRARGNDLAAPAMALAPPIVETLDALGETPGCLLAQMSGSGATCFGLYADADAAHGAAAMVTDRAPGWWTVAAPLLTAPPDLETRSPGDYLEG